MVEDGLKGEAGMGGRHFEAARHHLVPGRHQGLVAGKLHDVPSPGSVVDDPLDSLLVSVHGKLGPGDEVEAAQVDVKIGLGWAELLFLKDPLGVLLSEVDLMSSFNLSSLASSISISFLRTLHCQM